MAQRVLVVGGGLAGLAAAHRLLATRPGLAVTVVDAADRPGGKARGAEVAGVRLDVGAESILAGSATARTLLAELGLADRIVHPEPVPASIWSRGGLHPIPTGTFLGVPGSAPQWGGLLTDAEAERAAHPLAVEAGEDRSVAEVVGGAVGRAVVDRVVEPMLGGVYAGRVEELSFRATMPLLQTALDTGAALTESVDRLLPPPGGAPRPPRLMGVDGGIHTVAGALAASVTAAGGVIRSGEVVRELAHGPAGWRAVLGPAAKGVPGAPPADLLDVDAVVLATPPAPTARLLRLLAPTAAAALEMIPVASMAVVVLALPRAAAPDLPGTGFLVPAVDGRTIKAATFSCSKWAWLDAAAAAQDVVLLRASVGRLGETAMLRRPDEEIVAAAHAEVGEALGVTLPAPVDQLVHRWGGGLPQYTTGHLDRVAAVRAAVARLPGVAVAGAAYDGVGIAAVLDSAETAAAAVLAHLTARGGPPSTARTASEEKP